MNQIFFQSWESIMRIIITTVAVYPALIAVLLATGKRSLSKLNMFDFIVTIALGSAFASMVILRSVTALDGLVAAAMLLGAQYVITWASYKWPAFEDLIKSEPTLVFHSGKFLVENMREVRLTREEIYAEMRQKGYTRLQDIHAVVLETNGNVSVLPRKESQEETIEDSTLVGVEMAVDS
jgi:uncharacterized membrane protein YcaP (DUF421 family)